MKWTVAILIFLAGLVGCSSISHLTASRLSPQAFHERRALLVAWNPFSEKKIIPLLERVRAHVTYKSDGDGDVWQTPQDTFKKGTGDCEDMNMLLASALLAEGYDVCVVVGSTNPEENYINHAWVLLKLSGKSYYLDTTRILAPKTLAGYEVEKSRWHVRYTIRPLG